MSAAAPARIVADFHDSLPTTLQIRAGIRRAMGSLDAALEDIERGLVLYERTVGPESPHLVWLLLELAHTQLDLDRPHDALASVERTWRIVEGQSLQPGHYGDLLFAHARALWETGGDRRQARAKAEEALEFLTRAPISAANELPALQRWLESHPAP